MPFAVFRTGRADAVRFRLPCPDPTTVLPGRGEETAGAASCPIIDQTPGE
ncbi:hypothetical protein [Streptomyces sp. GC420]|nr:hypothetical protein [Streptomyces sp. GC420]NBM19996.1 hypothetical protein [Streptomyces sp. GC420]